MPPEEIARRILVKMNCLLFIVTFAVSFTFIQLAGAAIFEWMTARAVRSSQTHTTLPHSRDLLRR